MESTCPPKYPSADHPLVLTMRGKPASLKNDRMLIDRLDAEGHKHFSVGKSPSVRRYIAQATDQFTRQRISQGFHLVPMPEKIGVLVFLYLYLAPKAALPNGDNDNCYTTFQEALQMSVIEDDKQVRTQTSIWLPAKARKTEMLVAYLWRYEGEPLNELLTVLAWTQTAANPFHNRI